VEFGNETLCSLREGGQNTGQRKNRRVVARGWKEVSFMEKVTRPDSLGLRVNIYSLINGGKLCVNCPKPASLLCIIT
jgi:hypothetical protein